MFLEMEDFLSSTPNTLPIKMIEVHTESCDACTKRRGLAHLVLAYQMDPFKNLDEIIARDKLIDQLFADCEKCFRKTIKKI